MTTQSVVDAARLMLQDVSVVRWDEVTMAGYVVLAEQRLFELRPDLWVSASGVMGSASASSGTITPNMTEALAHYAAYLALSEDDSDHGNAQNAALHLALFNQIVRGAK